MVLQPRPTARAGRVQPRVMQATGVAPESTLLSARELEVLRLLAKTHSYREIAGVLVISEETVRSHVKHILRKLGQPDRTGAVLAALRAGILPP
jgi:DNA-binding NarL/FixJ family response regulator